jgi:hypothetical protein
MYIIYTFSNWYANLKAINFETKKIDYLDRLEIKYIKFITFHYC